MDPVKHGTEMQGSGTKKEGVKEKGVHSTAFVDLCMPMADITFMYSLYYIRTDFHPAGSDLRQGTL